MTAPALHIVSLPHTETTSAFSICAYTQKVVKFCRMMLGRSEIFLYSGELNEAPCAKHIPLLTVKEREMWCGAWNPQNPFVGLSWDPTHPAWKTMNRRAVAELKEMVEPHDLILLIAGLAQKPIADAFPAHLVVEWGVGYEGFFSNFCAFESYAWMHYLYGKRGIDNGRYYDQVIPNYFDPEEFTVGRGSEDLLFLGRLTLRKGPHVASDIAKRAGRRLRVAGPGATRVTKINGVTRIEADQVVLEGPHLDYIGPIGIRERADLLASVGAVLMPTQYIEPFGGVAVEAMMAGTPVIASDWGAFTETIEEGRTGFRFRTLAEGVRCVEDCDYLNREDIASVARDHYSLDAVAPQFERWFTQLSGLWGEGWSA